LSESFIRVEKPKRKLLNPEYIPTPLVTSGERPPIKVVGLKEHRRLSGFTVVMRFIAFGLRILFRKLQGRGENAQRSAVEARELFQGLGGLWIKLAQFLSLRTDLFSVEMCKELSQTLYSNIGFPAEIAKKTIERELGSPLEAIFSSFEDQPLAAASIAQVHRAVLRKEGVPVVIKLLRPNVIEAFRRDMGLLHLLVGLLGILMPLRHLRLNEALDELNGMVEEELNYTYETSNCRQLRKVLRRHKVYVPYVFRSYCTEKVLVMEEISGVLMSDAIAVNSSNPKHFEAWCEENLVQPKKVATHLFMSNMRQLLEDNLFHGDMHPGNILLLRNNRYALIDFGTIGSLNPGFLQIYLAVLRAINRREWDRAASLSLHLCVELPSFEIDKLRVELVNAFKLWMARSEFDSLSYHERSLGASSKIIGQVFMKYNLQINWAALRMGRTWGTLDTSLAYFYPEMNHAKMFSRYIRDAQRRKQKNRIANFREGLVQVLDSANQYRVLLEPVLQKATITYKQKINKLSLIFATIMRFIYISLILLLGFVVHVYLHQRFPGIGDYPGAALAKIVPMIEDKWFALTVFAVIMVSVLLRRLIKIVSASYLR